MNTVDPNMQLEVEIKLGITEAAIPLLQQHHLLQESITPRATQHLVSTYFDTPDIVLRRQGFALRIRQDQQRYTQTLKGRAPDEAGLTARQEWEWDLPGFALDLSLITVPVLQALLRDPAVTEQIKPLFVTQFDREYWNIFHGDSKVEVALDRGEVIAGDRRARIQEVELELKSGTVEDLRNLADIFMADLGLVVEKQSKAARGYALGQIV